MIIVERGDCPDDVIEAGEFRVIYEPEYCARLTVRCKEQCPVAETGIFDIICPREPLRCDLHNGIGGAFGCYLFNLEVPLAIRHKLVILFPICLWTPNQAHVLGMGILVNNLKFIF